MKIDTEKLKKLGQSFILSKYSCWKFSTKINFSAFFVNYYEIPFFHNYISRNYPINFLTILNVDQIQEIKNSSQLEFETDI